MSNAKSAQVIQIVKDMIMRGELRPGDKLPSEDVFAAQLGLSRNSMREAVRALSAMQVLVARQGDGTYVSSLEPHIMLESLSFAVDIAGVDSVLHFLQVRRMLESQAAMIAAASRSQRDLAELHEIHAASIEEGDGPKNMELDIAFHARIAALAGNPVLSSLLNVVSSPTVRARIWRGRREDRSLAIRIREHGLILSAIERQDPQSAMIESYNHVMGVERWIRENSASLDLTTTDGSTIEKPRHADI